ncbi:MAG: DUF362 domain-containing protein [Desulfobacteraceae bacterium]|nr:DUF362 domain-containing protein [Desulfobacteraceae bacterium]MBC2751383.1 DUF362 domain-containing protein [Desulfobacteraceae bacterium]
MTAVPKSRVTLARIDDRASGVQQTIRALAVNPAKNKDVLIKPNFNTADPAPGSTHNDTLVALVDELWQMGARSISVGERSYPRTASVMEAKGIVPLLEARDVRIIDFDALPDEDWVKVDAAGSHWRDGFRVARPVLDAACLVSAGCLKTHQFGGVFTLSLKLHVGVVPTTRHGYDYMAELHGSPHQQELIAEINAPFTPDLVVLDGVEAFVDGGPATGKRVRGDVVLAATDRVAIDAVGVAILKHLGSNAQVMTRPIFFQKQIARAVELGLGADSPEAIELVATDPSGEDFRDRVAAILSQG